jgi:hypothetical protein
VIESPRTALAQLIFDLRPSEGQKARSGIAHSPIKAVASDGDLVGRKTPALPHVLKSLLPLLRDLSSRGRFSLQPR